MGSVIENAIHDLTDALGEVAPIVGIVIVLAVVFLAALSLEQYLPGSLGAALTFIFIIAAFIICLYCIKERVWESF